VRAPHPPALFVYGTLQFPPVLEALLGRVPPLSPGTLDDHAVVGLVERTYPGLVTAPGDAARGWVCKDLGDAEWLVIDSWEDDDYELVTVSVTVRGREPVCCGTYRLARSEAGEGSWSAARFATTELASFAAASAQWRRSLPPAATDAR
jgi:hypothetical protein